MGLVLGFIFLFGLGLSFVVMLVTIGYQRKLRKNERGSSWAGFLTATFALTLLIGWLGAGVWPAGHGGAPTGHDYELSALSTFLISLAPGLGFIFAYIFSRKK